MSILKHFKHINLTEDQNLALSKLEAFIANDKQVFILKGYAGSGKTTILKGLVEYLNEVKKGFALMAPTGRAAKVIREKTGVDAYTVHKSIFSYDDLVEVEEGDSFYYYYKIRNNDDVYSKIFIVDEASMLSDAKSEGEFFRFGSSHLLTDLITYTRVAESNAKTKIIFIGDPCQLPPVSDNSSKAFDAAYLNEKFGISSEDVEMKQVIRQGGESGILKAATKIRNSITAGYFNDFNLRTNETDIFNPTFEAFLDAWQKIKSTKVIIAYKNKTCLDLNLRIRELIFGKANLPIQKSDIIILGSNNYRKHVFNGEFGVINEVGDVVTQRTILLKGKESVTLRWRDVELVFPDTETTNKVVKGKILENFLYGENKLRPEETQALYVDFRMRHKELKPKTEEFKLAILDDDYFNCLLMKFGYAVTCHKAQGGEWDNVFTIWDNVNTDNFDYYQDEQLRAGRTNESFYRWAYTAITRASSKLFAINPPFFNSYSGITFIDTPVLNALNQLAGQQMEAEEVPLDEELRQLLIDLNLINQPIQIQDHFITVRHAVRRHFIDVVNWQIKDYEIRYTFQREDTYAVFKTSVNGRNEFRNPIIPIPSSSPNNEFNRQIEDIIRHLPNVTIIRNTVETIIHQIEFDRAVEEEFPFTRCLFDDINMLLGAKDIRIEEVVHLKYRERYKFTRHNEKATIDFEYDGRGFFGRCVPGTRDTNSHAMLTDIKELLEKLKS